MINSGAGIAPGEADVGQTRKHEKIPDESSEMRHTCLSHPQQAELRTDSLGKNQGHDRQLAVERSDVGRDSRPFWTGWLIASHAFLTIVFMVPVSIPGVSTVFGSAILLISISRLLGRNLWLPKRMERRVLPAERLRAGLTAAACGCIGWST